MDAQQQHVSGYSQPHNRSSGVPWRMIGIAALVIAVLAALWGWLGRCGNAGTGANNTNDRDIAAKPNDPTNTPTQGAPKPLKPCIAVRFIVDSNGTGLRSNVCELVVLGSDGKLDGPREIKGDTTDAFNAALASAIKAAHAHPTWPVYLEDTRDAAGNRLWVEPMGKSLREALVKLTGIPDHGFEWLAPVDWRAKLGLAQ